MCHSFIPYGLTRSFQVIDDHHYEAIEAGLESKGYQELGLWHYNERGFAAPTLTITLSLSASA